jgi:prepilin-type N-terminal cleavage/methylation domain-containing protein
MKSHRSGFTLVEILVTIAIVAGLGATGLVCVGHCRKKAQCVIEINAARNLAAAYLSHAADHSGRVMAGYQTDPDVTNIEGNPLHYPMNARYPWRLAPCVPKIEGVMLFNGNESALTDRNRDYLVSVHPNLGLNSTLVGGHFGTGSPLAPTPKLVEVFGKFHLTHLSEADSPERLVVFASARSGTDEPGYFEIRPPNLNKRNWSAASFSETQSPADHGFTDFRWSGKAVCAMLGGNVEVLDESALRDMRRWSIQAQRADNPDYRIGQR